MEPLDYENWPVRTIKTTSLKFDLNNPRLFISTAMSQKDALRDLFNTENAIDVAEAIANNGYLPIEFPIVVQLPSGKFTVTEGNRRLAAIKGLTNPELVPAFQTRLRKAALKIDLAKISKLKVKIAPSYEEASRFSAIIHTSQGGRRNWPRAQQENFIYTRLVNGSALSDLKEMFPTTDVGKLARRAAFRSLLSEGLSDQSLADLWNGKHDGASALERLTSKEEFREVMGVKLGSDPQDVKTILSESVFTALSELVVRKIMDDEWNTRTLDKMSATDEPPEWLVELKGIRSSFSLPQDEEEESAPESPQGSTSATNGTNQNSTTSPKESSDASTPDVVDSPPAKPVSKRSRVSPTKLESRDIIVPDKLPFALKQQFTELTKLNVNTSPNAAFALARIVLEKTIKSFASHGNFSIRHPNSKKTGAIQLDESLKWLGQHTAKLQDYGLAKNATFRNSVNIISASEPSQFSVASIKMLNNVAHEKDQHVTSDQLRELWHSMHIIIKLLFAAHEIDPSTALEETSDSIGNDE